MATIKEERARLQFLEEHGHGDEKCHVILIEVEAAERIKNPKQKTRFVVQTDSPEMYSLLNQLKDRWFAVANKSVALSVMADLWDIPEQGIREMCADEPRQPGEDADRA
jgi:hypothetical protein